MADGDPEAIDFLTLLRGVNETAPFNRWAGFVGSAAGKRQVFTTAELFAERDGASKLVATGTRILAVPA